MILISQIFGFFAVAFWIFSVQNKKQYEILFFQFIANFIYIIHYILLGVFSAASMNLIAGLMCLLFSYKRKYDKDISFFWLLVFIILILCLGVLTYDGILSLIPVVITLFYTISAWMKDSKWIRIIFLITSIIWIYYNFAVGGYVAIVGNVFSFISGIISLIRFPSNE